MITLKRDKVRKSCKSIKRVHLYFDDELPREEIRAFEAHLKVCTQCRHELNRLEEANSFLTGMAEIEPSADFSRTFWEKVDTYEDKKASGRYFNFFTKLRVQGFAIALAVVTIAGLTFFVNGSGKREADEMIMTVDIEMLQEYELIENLDLLENFDEIIMASEEG